MLLNFSQVGCPDEKVLVDASEIDDLPEVVNDLDWDFDPSEHDAVCFHFLSLNREM